MSAPIVVVPYDPGWAQEYAVLASRLRADVGGAALRIDHIGSTAVPALAAKNVIDIQITVTDLSDPRTKDALGSIGYRYVPGARDSLVGVPAGSSDLDKQFFRQPEGHRRTHIHVRELGRVNQRYPLVFRDYLRSDVSMRQAYENVKTELARHFEKDSAAYYAIKDPYMDTVYQAALLWARQTDWQPDSEFS